MFSSGGLVFYGSAPRLNTEFNSLSKWCFIAWKLLKVVIHDCQHVFHCLYSILLRLMKSRQKRVWTFCRILLNIIMHNASKCCNALSFSYHFLFCTRFCFPLFECIRTVFHNCDVPGVWIFLFWGCRLPVEWESEFMGQSSDGERGQRKTLHVAHKNYF